jgi:hypothetical protein
VVIKGPWSKLTGWLAAGRPLVAVRTCKLPAAALKRSIEATPAVLGSFGTGELEWLLFLQEARNKKRPRDKGINPENILFMIIVF